MMGDFHQQGHARGAVVGAQERQLAWRSGSTSWSAMRPGVVVGADHDATASCSGCHEPIRLTMTSALAGQRDAAAWKGCSRTFAPIFLK